MRTCCTFSKVHRCCRPPGRGTPNGGTLNPQGPNGLGIAFCTLQVTKMRQMSSLSCCSLTLVLRLGMETENKGLACPCFVPVLPPGC